MPRKKSKTLTELELEIMQVLWERAETSIEELSAAFAARGRPLAESSFRKMLSILGDKGYVARRRIGRGFVYTAIIPAADAERSILRDVVERVFDGSAAGLVAALVRQGMVDENDLATARRAIRKREEKD